MTVVWEVAEAAFMRRQERKVRRLQQRVTQLKERRDGKSGVEEQRELERGAMLQQEGEKQLMSLEDSRAMALERGDRARAILPVARYWELQARTWQKRDQRRRDEALRQDGLRLRFGSDPVLWRWRDSTELFESFQVGRAVRAFAPLPAEHVVELSPQQVHQAVGVLSDAHERLKGDATIVACADGSVQLCVFVAKSNRTCLGARFLLGRSEHGAPAHCLLHVPAGASPLRGTPVVLYGCGDGSIRSGWASWHDLYRLPCTSDAEPLAWTTKEAHELPFDAVHQHDDVVYGLLRKGDKVYSWSADGTVKRWQLSTGELEHTFRLSRGGVASCALSHDGRFLVTAGDELDPTIRLWDALFSEEAAAAAAAPREWLDHSCSDCDFARRMARLDDQVLRSVAHQQELFGLGVDKATTRDAEAQRMQAEEADQAAARARAARDEAERLRDEFPQHHGGLIRCFHQHFEEGKLLPPSHGQWINQVALNEANTLAVSGASDNSARLWAFPGGEPLRRFFCEDWVLSCAIGHVTIGGALVESVVTGCADSTITLWRAATGEPLQVLRGHTDVVSSVQFMRGARFQDLAAGAKRPRPSEPGPQAQQTKTEQAEGSSKPEEAKRSEGIAEAEEKPEIKTKLAMEAPEAETGDEPASQAQRPGAEPGESEKAAAETDDKPETETDDKPETETDDKPETETDDKPETETDDKPETETDDKPETETGLAVERPEAGPGDIDKAETETETEDLPHTHKGAADRLAQKTQQGPVGADYIRTCSADGTLRTWKLGVGPPFAPPAPEASDPSDTAVTLRWDMPVQNGSAVTSFVIEYREGGAGDFEELLQVPAGEKPGDALKERLQGLRPGGLYEFRVAAVSKMGRGPFSPASAPRRCLPAAPGRVDAPIINETSTTELDITWLAPASFGSHILHFEVQYRGGTRTRSFEDCTPVKVSWQDGARKAEEDLARLQEKQRRLHKWILDNQHLGTKETLKMRRKLKASGEASRKRQLLFGFAKSQAGGAARRARQTQAAAAAAEAGCGKEASEYIEMSCKVSGLEPGMAYQVRVAATNRVGRGPFSPPSMSELTATCRPDGVADAPELQGATTDTLRVGWVAPRDNGAPLLGFELRFGPSAELGRLQALLAAEESARECGLARLRSEEASEARSAIAEAASDLVSTEVVAFKDSRNLAADDLLVMQTATAVMLHGNDEMDHASLPSREEIDASMRHADQFVERVQRFRAQVMDPETLAALRPSPGPLSAATVELEKALKPARSLKQPLCRKIRVWLAAVARFERDFYAPAWAELSVANRSCSERLEGEAALAVLRAGPKEASADVPGVKPGAGYRFQVRAVNEHGPGPFSPVSRAFFSKRGPPEAPTAVEAGEATSSALTVRWRAPEQDNGAVLLGYHVLQRSNRAGAYIPVRKVEASGPTETRVTGLEPNSLYEFRVAAVSELGRGPDSAPSAPAATEPEG